MPYLRLILVAGIAGLVSLSAYWIRSDGSDRPGPQRAILQVPEPVLDLGVIDAYETRTARFSVKNLGTQRLLIHQIDRECGCDDSYVRTTAIPPGRTENVEVALIGYLPSGPIEQFAEFASNDAERPRFRLTVKAVVRREP